METKNTNFGLKISDEHKHSHQQFSLQLEKSQESTSRKPQYRSDLANVSTPKDDILKEQRGVDNRLRAIFGKMVPQFFTFLYNDPATCFSYLKDACAAEDANDRAGYLHVISQIWDRIQSHRKNSRKRTRPGNSNRIAKRVKKLKPIVEEVDEEAPALAQQQPTFEASNILNGRDLLWIVKYAEFGRLVTQLTKAKGADICFLVLGNAKIMDDLKSEVCYDKTLRTMRDMIELHEQKSATILHKNM